MNKIHCFVHLSTYKYIRESETITFTLVNKLLHRTPHLDELCGVNVCSNIVQQTGDERCARETEDIIHTNNLLSNTWVNYFYTCRALSRGHDHRWPVYTMYMFRATDQLVETTCI